MGVKRDNKFYNDAVELLSRSDNCTIENLYFLCTKNINYDDNLAKLSNMMNTSEIDEERYEAAKRIIMLGTREENRSNLAFKGVLDYVVTE